MIPAKPAATKTAIKLMPLADVHEVLRRPSGEQLDSWAKRLADDATQRRSALDLARSLLAPAPPTSHDNDSGAKGPVVKLNAALTRLPTFTAAGHRLVGVADGMGGAPGGEVASALAVTLLQSAFTGRSADELAAGVRAVNRAICVRTSRKPTKR